MAAIDSILSMPTRGKVALLAAVALSVAAMVLAFSWSQRPDYQILYASLSEGDAGHIAQRLQEMRVPYKATGGGGLMVPSDRVYDLRIQLAADGLPAGGTVGFELFDKTNFNTTDFVQKLNYKRAMQGELARTIASLGEVERARIHLVMPERSLFASDEARPSASVLLKLRTGRTLSKGQVNGIVHLVASSVERLHVDDVTVVDSRGQMLTGPSDEGLGLTAGQLEYRREYERQIQARILGILEPVVGKGKVRSEVAATLDFTRTERTEESFDPDSQVARSEQKNTEKTSSSGSRGGSVPGVTANLPGRAASAVQGGGQSSQTQKQNEVVNYEINKVTSRFVAATGGVKRLTAAVLVDGTYTVQEGSEEPVYVPRSDEDMRHYEELVKRAIGYSGQRGDEVRVTNLAFAAVAQQELPEPEGMDIMGIAMKALKGLAPVVAVALFFIMVVKPLLRVLSAPQSVRVQGMPELPQTVAELEGAKAPQAIGAVPGGNKGEVLEWAEKNPEKAADIIKSWIQGR